MVVSANMRRRGVGQLREVVADVQERVLVHMYLLQEVSNWPAEGGCAQCRVGWNPTTRDTHVQFCYDVRLGSLSAQFGTQIALRSSSIVMNSYLRDSSKPLSEWQGDVEAVARQLWRLLVVGTQRRSLLWGGDFNTDLPANCEGWTGAAAGFTSSTAATRYRERSDARFKIRRDHNSVVPTTLTEPCASTTDRRALTGPSVAGRGPPRRQLGFFVASSNAVSSVGVAAALPGCDHRPVLAVPIRRPRLCSETRPSFVRSLKGRVGKCSWDEFGRHVVDAWKQGCAEAIPRAIGLARMESSLVTLAHAFEDPDART